MQAVTHCEHCCFSSKDDPCSLGKVQEYEQAGFKVEQKNGYNLIYGKTCRFSRTDQWLEKYGPNHQDQLKEENRIRYDLVLNVDHDEPEDIVKLYQKLERWECRPRNFLMICTDKEQFNKIKSVMVGRNTIPYNIKLGLNKKDFEKLVREFIFSKKIKQPFYCSLEHGIAPFKKTIEKLNDFFDGDNAGMYYENENMKFVWTQIHWLGTKTPKTIIEENDKKMIITDDKLIDTQRSASA